MYVGSHGTNFDHVESIIANNFVESNSSDDWLGKGAYFFIDGCNDQSTHDLALEWAKAHHWDNKRKCYTCEHVATFDVDISCDDDKILDMTKLRGRKLFNAYRESLKKSISKGLKLKPKKALSDTSIFNSIRNNLGIEAILCDMYIKFEYERVNVLHSRLPNCTIIAVSNTQENIDVDTLRVINKVKV